MNIRPSLKLHFFVMMLMAGVATISIMSIVSINYFFVGIDFSMYGAMRSQAFQHPVSDGNPIKVNDFTIASQWRDLPAPIREKLNEQDLQSGELLKFVEGNPFFSKPKAGYFAISAEHDGQTRYVSKMFNDASTRMFKQNNPPYFNYILWIALIAIALFSLVPYFVLRNVAAPVERLMLWAKQLNNKEKLAQPVPDFHYRELNSLASIVQSSLHSVEESLSREQRFLGYASHELRTPIAVTRTNSELLRKMMSKEISVEKQLQVLDRIERACLTMTDLTETLLWLNRQPDRGMPETSLALGALTEQLLVELNYLHEGKEIQVSITTDASEYLLPEALCRIIIINLIRNALQHTQQGEVTIHQSMSKLIISNQNVGNNPLHSEELGFGLGLELTERLVHHYGWQYSNIANSTGHYVEIDFRLHT